MTVKFCQTVLAKNDQSFQNTACYKYIMTAINIEITCD